jgi:hypothetical protein
VRLALAIGAGSGVASASSVGWGVITGRIVERDSGNLRVRKSVDDCRYVLEICDEGCLEDMELREDDSSWDEVNVSRVGVRVVAMLPEEVIVLNCWRAGRELEDTREGEEGRREMRIDLEC